MRRWISRLVVSLCLAGWAAAQVEPLPSSEKGPGQNQPPPRSERSMEAGESSSRDTRIDLSPPKDDVKNHPNSGEAVADAEGDSPSEDVQEFHPWNPHKAMKDIEVGDFYFKRKNYRGALERYREALEYKPKDALATFRLAQCLEKLAQPEEARVRYEEYLKILPHGPLFEDAQKALQKLKAGENQAKDSAQPKN